ncbi:c-type cytochrome [Altererythrobacter indicus]|uniref:C-type cytochrome n=1 Tax=Altericroceibacterium indicum TaxID=374177 RepID=A0A845A3J4_9SPHN|nr:c-type cytochrome [Altericroceibacterium indicum]MXP24750.1 c-type cytochrome [Altericroceibacterium indicum]
MRHSFFYTQAAAILLIAPFLGACSDDRHDERLAAAGPNPSLSALMKVADADAGARKFGQCAACHTIRKGGADKNGPNLHGIFGKRMGQGSRAFSYTAALSNAGGTWDAQTLDAWLQNPQKVVPGTKMQFGGIADPLNRADVIAYLQKEAD